MVKEMPDAIYMVNQDRLVFKNLATISSIFKGIDELYKEATKEQVLEFLNEPYIELDNGYGVEKVSKQNRSRIALAMDTLAEMPSADIGQIVAYINSYCDGMLDFNSANSKFKIKTDEELKYLLYGIEQRFYTTPLGQEKRLANSVQALV